MERIVYKQTDEGELYVLYAPGSQPNAPLFYWIHGGGWRVGHAEDNWETIYQWFAPLAEAGFAFASVEYRLTGKDKSIRFDDQYGDVLDGLCCLCERADTLGFDPQRVVTSGSSSGGHLTLMTACAARAFRQSLPFRIALCIECCGPVELSDREGYADSEFAAEVLELLHMLIGMPLNEQNLPAYRRASPLYYVNPESPPIFIIHGTQDRIVPFHQASLLYDRARLCGVPVVLCPINAASHDFPSCIDGKVPQPDILTAARMACAWALSLVRS